MRRIAIVGAGCAGLAAAVHAVDAGHDVHVFEMARQAGGRASSRTTPAGRLDNGQHILIGAYRDTLALMRRVGVDVERSLFRSPLVLRDPQGCGLELPAGPPAWSLVRAVMRAGHWPTGARLRFVFAALSWRARGFECPESWSVRDLCRHLPDAVVDELLEPLCVAALNTPIDRASGRVFLRVIRDAVFGDAGSADLLLPRAPLSDVLADPAAAWLQQRGATWHWGHRVMQLVRSARHWRVDDVGDFDGVVIATPAGEASRLVRQVNAEWSRSASRIDFEPIVTVWLTDPALRWPHPMVAMRAGPDAPAQFGFDLGSLGGPAGHFTFVISGAGVWLARGLPQTSIAVLAQARSAYPGHFVADDALAHAAAERRATFACTPALGRPPLVIAERLAAAGDYVDGPYPATLEGAVRSGRAASDHAMDSAGAADIAR